MIWYLKIPQLTLLVDGYEIKGNIVERLPKGVWKFRYKVDEVEYFSATSSNVDHSPNEIVSVYVSKAFPNKSSLKSPHFPFGHMFIITFFFFGLIAFFFGVFKILHQNIKNENTPEAKDKAQP